MHFPRPEARIYSRKTKKQRPSKTAENGAGAHPQKSYDCNKRFTCTEQLAQRDGFKASLEASMEIAARQKFRV